VPWWGAVTVELSHTRELIIGPLTLSIRRLPGEWRLCRQGGGHIADSSATRFAVSGQDGQLQLLPALADRPVVARPEEPFHIAAHDECTVFVGSPAWVRVATAGPPGVLCEFPIQVPSDTWFGPTTMTGELCYASRTYCRLHYDEIEFRPHRVLSAVTIRNRSRQSLVIQRIMLPAVYLSLFAGAGGTLWTQDITIDQQDEQATSATVKFLDRPHRVAGGAARLLGPRRPAQPTLAMRVLGSLLADRSTD
jgi:hypothetical protein